MDSPLHSVSRKRHPRQLGEQESIEFLSDLAVKRNVSASTQNQAFCALLFLYQQFLERKLGRFDGALRASKPARFPVVLRPTLCGRQELQSRRVVTRSGILSPRICSMTDTTFEPCRSCSVTRM